jgi:23S rRNA (guanosine2251-2'-O)-methyltransferase
MIIIPKRRMAKINEVCIKASVGGIFMLPIISVSNILYEIEKLVKKDDFKVYAMVVDKLGEDINRVERFSKRIIVLGEEHKGISHNILRMADYKVYIPINDEIGSLNVSVSAGIILHYFR